MVIVVFHHNSSFLAGTFQIEPIPEELYPVYSDHWLELLLSLDMEFKGKSSEQVKEAFGHWYESYDEIKNVYHYHLTTSKYDYKVKELKLMLKGTHKAVHTYQVPIADMLLRYRLFVDKLLKSCNSKYMHNGRYYIIKASQRRRVGASLPIRIHVDQSCVLLTQQRQRAKTEQLDQVGDLDIAFTAGIRGIFAREWLGNLA